MSDSDNIKRNLKGLDDMIEYLEEMFTQVMSRNRSASGLDTAYDKRIVQQVFDPNLKLENGQGMLISTLNGISDPEKQLRYIKLLLLEGADVNEGDMNGCTPLMIAIQQSYEKTARVLITPKNTDHYMKDYNGWTALHHAAAGAREGVMRHYLRLLRKLEGTKTENDENILELFGLENNDGKTAEQLAEDLGNHSMAELIANENSRMLKKEIETSRDNIKRNLKGLDDMIEYLEEMFEQVVSRNRSASGLDTAYDKRIVQQVFDPNLKLENGQGMLISTLNGISDPEKQLRYIKLLLLEGADMNDGDMNGCTPLMIAIQQSYEKTARILITPKNTDHFMKDNNGWTALHHAAAGGREGVMRHYLRLLRKLEEKKEENDESILELFDNENNDGKTAQQLAEDLGNHGMAELIANEKSRMPKKEIETSEYQVTPKILKNKEEMIDYLVLMSKRSMAVTRCASGLSDSMDIDMAVNLEVLDPNAKLENGDCMLIAIIKTVSDPVKQLYYINYLLEESADVNRVDAKGRTALMIAVEQNYEKAANSLLTHKLTNHYIKDNNGWTVLHHMAANGQQRMLSNYLRYLGQLVEKKMMCFKDIFKVFNLKNNDGQTAEQLAKKQGHPITAEMIAEA